MIRRSARTDPSAGQVEITLGDYIKRIEKDFYEEEKSAGQKAYEAFHRFAGQPFLPYSQQSPRVQAQWEYVGNKCKMS